MTWEFWVDGQHPCEYATRNERKQWIVCGSPHAIWLCSPNGKDGAFTCRSYCEAHADLMRRTWTGQRGVRIA